MSDDQTGQQGQQTQGQSGQQQGEPGKAGEQGAQGQQQQQNNQGQQGQQPAAWTKLDIPPHLKGETAEATLEKLFPAFNGYRQAEAKRGPVGKSAADYAYTPDEALKPWIKGGDDPLLKSFQAAALEEGLPLSVAKNIIDKTFKPLVEKGLIAKPYNPQAEHDGVAKLIGKEGPQNKEAVTTFVRELETWTDNVGKQLGLSETGAAELGSLTYTAGGVEVLKALQDRFGQAGMAIGGRGAGQKLSKAELDEMGKDPRVDPYSAKFDKAFRKQ